MLPGLAAQRERRPFDFAMLARAQGLAGEGPVTDLAELAAALECAIDAVRNGAACVIDVVVRSGCAGAVASLPPRRS